MTRAIPDDNLAYPVLASIEGDGTGSGFFLNTAHSQFFVTAKHVLYEEKAGLLGSKMTLLSQPRLPSDTGVNEFELNLTTLEKAGDLKAHSKTDVAVVRIAVLEANSKTADGGLSVVPVDGVTATKLAQSGVLGVGHEMLRAYEDVLVANEVYIFGYPTSIGLKDIPQIDYRRPLLRRGIVSGKNEEQRTIVLDCPVFWGNSGGPVVQVEKRGLETHFNIIGLVSQFIPLVEQWHNVTHGYGNIEISNSGYSVAASVDSVIELVSTYAPPITQ